MYGARVSLDRRGVGVDRPRGRPPSRRDLAGYVGGFIDSSIMRLMDIMLAIPGLLLAIGIVAALVRASRK